MDAGQAREMARRLTGAGRDVSQVSAQVRGAQQVRWRALAAEAFRDRIAEEAGALRRVAASLEAAASAWQRHAAALDDGPHR